MVPPLARGNGSRVAPCVVDAAAGLLPPVRSSDLDRPPDAGCAPPGGENCGRKTDIVRLLPSNRSLRAPCLAVVLTSWMATGWIAVWVAAATRPTGIPWLMTRWLLPTIVADAAVV